MEVTRDALLQGFSLVVLVIAFQVVVGRWNLQKEAKRRWQHAITGHALVQISYLLPIDLCIALLWIVAALILLIKHFSSETYVNLFGELLRPDELSGERLPGAFYFLVGTAVTAQLFPLTHTRYSVECLSLSDPMASWIGRSLKSPKIHASASVAGCVACFLTALAIGMLYLDESTSWKKRIAAAFVCTFAEAMSFGYDNLLIPVATAAAIGSAF